jgi:hypothetical protein
MEAAASKLDTVIRGLLDSLLDAIWGGLSRDAPRPATGAPASPAQIAALERHWGHPLPPIFRSMLVSYNGMARLWFDVRSGLPVSGSGSSHAAPTSTMPSPRSGPHRRRW